MLQHALLLLTTPSSIVVNLAEAWSLEPLGILPSNLTRGACQENVAPDDTVEIWLCVDPVLEVEVVGAADCGDSDSACWLAGGGCDCNDGICCGRAAMGSGCGCAAMG